MNILRIIGSWFRTVINIIKTIWIKAVGIAEDAYDAAKSIIDVCLVVLGTIILAFIIGYVAKLTVLVWLASISASLVCIIAYKFSDIVVNIINGLIGNVPLVGKPVVAINEELKKLLKPVVIVSMFMALLSCIVGIRGPGYYSFTDIMILSSFLLFLVVFIVYVDAKTKFSGWIMISVLFYFMAGSYWWPIQIQGYLDKIEGITIHKALQENENGNSKKIGIIVKGTPLYDTGWGNEFKYLRDSLSLIEEVKIIDRKIDPNSKEGMYQVILPIRKNLYIGGEKVWVPARLVLTNKTKTPEKQNDKFPPGPQIVDAKLGLEPIVIGPGEIFGRNIPKIWYWHMKAPKNAIKDVDWEFITKGEKYFETDPRQFKDGDIVTKYPNQDMTYIVRASSLAGKEMVFKLLVKTTPITQEEIEKL